jgi:hypothetical protein
MTNGAGIAIRTGKSTASGPLEPLPAFPHNRGSPLPGECCTGPPRDSVSVFHVETGPWISIWLRILVVGPLTHSPVRWGDDGSSHTETSTCFPPRRSPAALLENELAKNKRNVSGRNAMGSPCLRRKCGVSLGRSSNANRSDGCSPRRQAALLQNNAVPGCSHLHSAVLIVLAHQA